MKIGIDIGGSHIATGIVKDGAIIGKETRDILLSDIQTESRAKEIILDIIKNEIKVLLQRHDYTPSNISRIGIAVPGSPSETSIRNLVNLHIDEYNLGTILTKEYNTKVTIKNDGKCAGLGEKEYGALKQYKDCVFLCIGTGVGSAVFMDNKLLKPHKNPGFEFGHMVIEKNGRECNCGKKGCFETYASMKRLKQTVIEQLKLDKDMQSEEIQNYIRKNINDENVSNIIDEYIENVAIGISNIINIFEPEAICFGGSFSYYDDIFIPRLKIKLKDYLFNKDDNIELISAKLKNDAGIIGSVL